MLREVAGWTPRIAAVLRGDGLGAAAVALVAVGLPGLSCAMGMLALDNVEAVLNGRAAPTLVPGRSREIV